jgi:hypothetical protein
MGRAAPDIPDGMRGVYGRFARWRKSNTRRLPIPASLTAAQAASDGIAAGQPENFSTGCTHCIAFVELLAAGTSDAECAIEVEGPRRKTVS